MKKRIDKPKSPTASSRSQWLAQVRHRTVFWGHPYDQAGEQIPRPTGWYFKGIERFVNTGDALKDYQALAKGWKSFWPLFIEDGEGHDLSWSREAHGLFIYIRDTLRRLWTRDPAITSEGFYLGLLFGTLSVFEIDEIFAREPKALRFPVLVNAVAPLVNSFPNLRFGLPAIGYLPQAGFYPNWGTGAIIYKSHTDFQRAIWFLFRESWRAKVCPQCSTYFIAQKPAQTYCSPGCSNAAHQASSLRWWREKGSKRRSSAKAKKAPAKAGRKGGAR